MKRLTFPLLLLASAWLASCEAPSDSSDSVMRTGPNTHGGGGTTAANPALAYIGSARSHGQTYPTIAVMDSDYAHQSTLYTSGTTGLSVRGPSWSPTNASIAFMENSNTIKAVDVTLNTDGTVSGTNARTIYSMPNSQFDNGYTVSWSNTTATNKIAFATRDPYSSRRTVWVISGSGGTPIKVWESDSSFVKEDGSIAGHIVPAASPTWSPDDSHIAIERLDSGASSSYYGAGPTRATTIMIFSTTDNGNTWAYTDSIKHSSTASNAYYPDIEWSSTGLNKLALLGYSDGLLYYANPTTGSALTTDGIESGGLSWSPNNSSILHCSGTALWKSVPFTTTTYGTGTNPSYGGNTQVQWKH
jgi:hypothetical protein